MPDFVTIEGVTICEAGTWQLSSGTATFTPEDLADAVLAASEDPTVSTPRLKLGHAEGSGWQSGEPSFGNFKNLRLAQKGMAIEADMETYGWMADLMPIAWPGRSVEGGFGYVSPAGKRYRFVINAVALLGVEWPGVSSLDDLEAALNNPEVVVVPSVNASSLPRLRVTAQINADDVRRDFYNTVAQGDRYWWWIRAVRLDPNEIIAEDDETGELYKVPFTVGDRTVTFGDPRQVLEEFVDAPVSTQEAVASHIVASWRSAKASRIDNRQREDGMDPQALREQLGLSADATDEQVSARISELRASAEAPAGTHQDEGEEEQAPTTPEVEEQPATVTVASQEGAVMIDRAALEQLQRDGAMGRAAREQQVTAEREAFVDRAIRAGKFPPARRDHYLKLLSADEEGTRTFIEGLAENVIPVVEAGAQGFSTEGEAGDAHGYDESWLTPAERERVRSTRAQMSGKGA